MKTLSKSSFKTLAGDGAYQRGQAYYKDGRVGPLSINKSRITALVAGTHDYSVVLHHTAKLFEGHCNCPASDNFDFCKHCVAVALSYYYQTQTNQELADAPGENQVLNYLNTLTQPQLADELYKLLLKDNAALDYWQLKAEIASGGLNAAEVRKRITKAIPYKPNGLWRYRDVAEYFANCEQALSLLDEPVQSLAPDQAIKVVTYAAQRLEKTLHTIDDSGGYRYPLEELLQAWFEQTMLSDQLANNAKAKVIVKLLTDRDYAYDVIQPWSVLNELSEDLLALIYSSLDKIWEELTPLTDHYSDDFYFYRRVERLLLERARHKNNPKKEFQILEKGAVTISRCVELVELCMQHKKIDDATSWLKQATEIPQTNVHQAYEIEQSQIKLYKAQGENQKAFDLEWARFEEEEDPVQLKTALVTAKTMGQHDVWLSEAIQTIEAKLTDDKSNPKNQRRAGALVNIHLDNDNLEAAYQLSEHYLMHVGHLIAIVNATDNFNKKTYKLIERVTHFLVRTATNSAYDDSISFLKKQSRKLDEANKDQFNHSVMRIYNEPLNKRKTNFVKRLKAAFPSLF